MEFCGFELENELGSSLVLRLGTELGLFGMELGIALGEPLRLRLGTELGITFGTACLLCGWIWKMTQTKSSTWIGTGCSAWIKRIGVGTRNGVVSSW
jgi:hypothetical protein